MSTHIQRAVRVVLAASAAAMVPLPSMAQEIGQEQAAQQAEEIIVTGTAIRRVEAEASLPVQVMSSEEIQRTGAQSVTDLVNRLPSLQGATVEAASVGGSTFGFAGASVHNIGETRTLVLLNGRRLAQFGGQTLTGFASAVDLNSIPVNAIERVEVLTSGASSLYGSDAVAGVVNFITKGQTTDRNVSVQYYGPQDGADEQTLSLSGGLGDYDADGWNVFATFSTQERDELRSADRDFADSAIVQFNHAGQRWVYFNGSPRNIPANVVVNNPASSLADTAVSLDLLGGGACPEGSAPTLGACYYDYVRDIQLYPERERRTATGSLNVKVGENHNVFVDALWSETEQTSRTAPVPGELLIETTSPLFAQYLAGVTGPDGEPLFVDDVVAPYRASDLGQRINADEAEFYQVTAGIEGDLAGWDYDFALTQSESDVKGFIGGYPGARAFFNALSGGSINPFLGPGEQSEAGQQALDAINYQGYWDGGVSQLQTAEVRASRALFDLPNGNPVYFAAGLSHYREEFESKPSLFAQAALADPVAGTPAPGGPGTGDQRFGDAAAAIPYSADRDVTGAFAEVVVQPLDWLELTGSARYDDYSDFGDTTNYKASVKITPTSTFMIRSSYGTGFRAPTVPQLNASLQSYGVTSNPYSPSPELQTIATGLGAILRPPQTQYDVFAGGNPDLQPEESRQAMVGFVWEATPTLSFGADYWWAGIENAFGQISETEAFQNPTAYPGAWTTFTDIGTGTTYLAYNQTNINTGREYYSGIDFNFQGRWDVGFGRLRSQLVATHMLRNKVQLTEGGPYFRNISSYSTELDTVTFRWSGRLMTSLEHGAFSHTLTANVRSGYEDVLTTVDGIDANGDFNGEVADVRLDVDDYYTFDWQSTWSPLDWLDVTVGALNVLDEDPPLSLTASNFQIGYDARYYDPRGRVLFGQVTFRF